MTMRRVKEQVTSSWKKAIEWCCRHRDCIVLSRFSRSRLTYTIAVVFYIKSRHGESCGSKVIATKIIHIARERRTVLISTTLAILCIENRCAKYTMEFFFVHLLGYFQCKCGQRPGHFCGGAKPLKRITPNG